MNKVEKIVLTILAIEHLGFGLYGLYDPYFIAELTGYILNSEFALSEIRAYYTLISALGFMALFAIFIQSIVDKPISSTHLCLAASSQEEYSTTYLQMS